MDWIGIILFVIGGTLYVDVAAPFIVPFMIHPVRSDAATWR